MKLLAALLLVAMATCALADEAPPSDPAAAVEEIDEKEAEQMIITVVQETADEIEGAVKTINEVFGNPACQDDEDGETRKRSGATRERRNDWLKGLGRAAWAAARKSAVNYLHDRYGGRKRAVEAEELQNYRARRGFFKKVWKSAKKAIVGSAIKHAIGSLGKRSMDNQQEDQREKRIWRKPWNFPHRIPRPMLGGKRSADNLQEGLRNRRGWLGDLWNDYVKPAAINAAVNYAVGSIGKRSDDDQEEVEVDKVKFHANLEKLKDALSVLEGVVAVAEAGEEDEKA